MRTGWLHAVKEKIWDVISIAAELRELMTGGSDFHNDEIDWAVLDMSLALFDGVAPV